MAPESTMSTTESASDTTTVRPRELERERFLLARRPGSPAMRSSSGALRRLPGGLGLLDCALGPLGEPDVLLLANGVDRRDPARPPRRCPGAGEKHKE
jgi:hypothetical protein